MCSLLHEIHHQILTKVSNSASVHFIHKKPIYFLFYFRSKYIDDKGKEYYSALTQFAPADARRCFPCWDEPAHKATFDIALTTSKSLTTLSNTSVQKTIPSGDVVK